MFEYTYELTRAAVEAFMCIYPPGTEDVMWTSHAKVAETTRFLHAAECVTFDVIKTAGGAGIQFRRVDWTARSAETAREIAVMMGWPTDDASIEEALSKPGWAHHAVANMRATLP